MPLFCVSSAGRYWAFLLLSVGAVGCAARTLAPAPALSVNQQGVSTRMSSVQFPSDEARDPVEASEAPGSREAAGANEKLAPNDSLSPDKDDSLPGAAADKMTEQARPAPPRLASSGDRVVYQVAPSVAAAGTDDAEPAAPPSPPQPETFDRVRDERVERFERRAAERASP